MNSHLTGVQRYTGEILAEVGLEIDQIAPLRPRHGFGGHVWEQLYLPHLLQGRLLWSPIGTGPLSVRHQVVTVHDLVSLEHPEWINSAFSTFYRFLQPRLLPRVTHIIAVSKFTSGSISENIKVPDGHVTIIPNGVSRRFSEQPDELVAKVRECCDLPSQHYVLSVGSLEPRKNLKRLLAAWKECLAEIPSDVFLVLVGKKGLRRVYADLDLGPIPPRVHFAGHVPDQHLPALISGALCFVYPSLYEGFGLPPLEAMACGTPVLSSNVTAIPEVVGDAGILIDPLVTADIANGILKLVCDTNLRQELKVRGLLRAKQFSWRNTAEKTLRLLQAMSDQSC